MSNLQGKTTTGIQPNLGGLLCYALWWITGIIFLILERENQFIRYHAVQSIIAFGAITIVQIILSFIPFLGWFLQWIIGVLAFIIWIVCMVWAYQGKRFKLPVAGDIAERNSKPAA